MKTRWTLLVVVLFLSMLLVSCDTDGEAWISIAYQTEAGVEYIDIVDSSKFNGIYADKENNQLYCQEGVDNVVKLPAETQWGESQDSPSIELEAEAICLMGQEIFDEFMQLFQLIQEP